MSIMADFFNIGLALVNKDVNLVRVGTGSIPIKIAPTAFELTTETFSEVDIEGRQFVVSKSIFDAAIARAGALGVSFKKIRQGDRFEATDYGPYTIKKIDELPGLAGEIVGWRITTN